MKIGLTGYSGMVGEELMKFPNVVPLACDVRNKEEVSVAVKSTQVDIIVHLASITGIDFCEDPKNHKLVNDTNVWGTLNVAEAADDLGREMVLLSTIHVFDGAGGNYREKSKPNPKNYYGLTKLAAEGFQQVFPFMKIVRTSYLFDYKRIFKHIYPLRAGKASDYPTFIERSFMYLPHFAEAFHYYLLNYGRMPHILNIGGSDTVSWYEFVCGLSELYGVDSSLVLPRSKELPGLVPRPFRGGLNVGLSEKVGIPQYNFVDGFAEMKEVSRL